MVNIMLSFYFCLCVCLSLCVVSIEARPRTIRHQPQIFHGRRHENKSHHKNKDATIDPCAAVNCNSPHSICAPDKVDTQKAVCVCEDGYSGTTCQIEPLVSRRCSMYNKDSRMDITCPREPKQFCVLDNLGCHFFHCASKGYCIPEK